MTTSSDLAVVEDTRAIEKLDDPVFQKLVRETYCQGANEHEFRLYLEQAKHLGLSPVAGEISQIVFGGRRTTLITIGGFRSIAHRSGKFGGRLGPQWCGKDGKWRDVWLDGTPPAAARVGIVRKDCDEPIWGVATWTSYAKSYKGKPGGNWGSMPDVMLAKCAEAQAIRAAFPTLLSGIYEGAEMDAVSERGERERPSMARSVDVPALEESEPTWQPTRESLLALQEKIEAAGIPFTPGNRQTFVDAKAALTGVALSEYEQRLDEFIESIISG